MADDQVKIDLLLEAAQALYALKQVSTGAETATQKIQMLTAAAKEFSANFGVNAKNVVSAFREVDESITRILDPKGWDAVEKNVSGTGESLVKTGAAAEHAAGSFEILGSRVNLVRTAFGTLLAIGIFQFIQLLTQSIKEAVNGLREFEAATYNLQNAERNLSNQGIGVTPKDLQDIVDKLQKIDPLLSKIQAMELVSSASSKVATSLGLNKEQIDQFSQSVVVFAIRNKALGKSFEETQSMMENAFLSGKVSVGINQLGVKITDQMVKEEALRMGLVKTEKEFDNLTGKQEANVKASAMLSLVWQNAQRDISHLPDFLKTADAAFGVVQAKWSNLLTFFGQRVGPILREVLLGIANILEKLTNYWAGNEKAIDALVKGTIVFVKIGLGLVNVLIDIWMWMGKFGEAIFNVVSRIQDAVSKIPGLKKIFGDVSTTPLTDTPTGTDSRNVEKEKQNQENIAKAVADGQSKIQDILQESADKKLDIENKYHQKLADIALDNQRRLEDIARETTQKREDAQRNYNQKVEDINRDAAEKAAQANQDARQKEIDREKEFQEKLRELREKFLFDLEDALRERDARQVLRLIRQYNMDKKSLEEKRKLDVQQSKKDLAQKLADIERDRVLKLQAAQRELAEKQAEIDRWAARERQDAQIALQRKLADARIAHQRELQEYQQYLQRKLQALAASIVKEYQLTAAGAAAIYKLLSSYYGAGGSISTLLGNALNASLNGIVSSPSSSSSGYQVPSGFQGSGLYGTYAEGGTLIATRPTKAVFGEKGPEMVSFTPLTHAGADVGKMFGNLGNNSQGQNYINLNIGLSNDLVAEIVDTSLENVAVHLNKISRSK